MKKRTKLIIVFTGLVLFYLIALNTQWIGYLLHLVEFQASAILSRKEIATLDTSGFSKDYRKKITLIKEVKEYAKKAYALESSKSFQYYVEIDRKQLGWNITVAPEFSFSQKNFNFLIGSFGYLGFFDLALLQRWRSYFQNTSNDVYTSVVAAYSTLGYFSDPIYSTYLEFQKKELIQLIFHEMSHEKLYFSDDTNFSERLSVFIEEELWQRYSKTTQKPANLKLRQKENEKIWKQIDSYKKKLSKLYKSKLKARLKRNKKQALYNELRSVIEKLRSKSKNTALDDWLLSRKTWNNALLIQVRRYTNKKVSGFKPTLSKCNGDLLCWFKEIEKLKKCSTLEREKFLRTAISAQDFVKKCKG